MAKMNWKSKNDMFDEKKRNKKDELSEACQRAILGYFKVELDGIEYLFSYDKEAQSNLMERWQLFQNNMIDNITLTAHTLDGKDVRIDANIDTFNKVYLESVKHKENNIKKLRDCLYPLVDQSMSVEDLESITWDAVIMFPEPQKVDVRGDRLLNDELQRLETETAVGTSELMGLIFMSQYQGL